MRFIVILLMVGLAFSQTITRGVIQEIFPVDKNSRPPAVQYYYDAASGSYKHVGPNSIIFDRMDGQYVTDVSTDVASKSALNLTSSFEPAGVKAINHTSNYMKVWFDMASNPTGASVPDTFWIPPNQSVFFPISADSVYASESASAPDFEIQQGRNN